MKARELLDQAEKGKCPSVLILRGDEPYVVRELKKALRSQGWEIQEKELKRTGPDPTVEDMGAGISLFQTQQCVWLKAVSSPTQWSDAGAKLWKKMSSGTDGVSLVLQVEADKRVQWTKWGSGEVVDLVADAAEVPQWLKRMNASRGNFLSADRLNFLAALEGELMWLDNWMELWMSGGDLWAERSIGWGKAPGASSGVGTNPVFAWVDAVLAGKRKDSQALLKKLLDDGEEPFQFLALLAKSVRILAQLDSGRRPQDQPDFLIQKLSRLKGSLRPGQAKRLLATTAEIDRLLKSSPVKASTLLSRL
jgi:DNA polymerase III delta subunit